VDAGTIVHDAVSNLLEALEESEIQEFLSEIISPSLMSMFVTPKDIDETIKRLSYTVSEGINMTFSNYT
jgi:spore protease